MHTAAELPVRPAQTGRTIEIMHNLMHNYTMRVKHNSNIHPTREEQLISEILKKNGLTKLEAL